MLKLKRSYFVLFSILFFFCATQIFAQERTKEFTIEDIFASNKFTSRSIRGLQWIEGGKAYSYLEFDTAQKQNNIWRYDVKSGKKSKIVDANDLVLEGDTSKFSIQHYVWSPDESKILFTGTMTARTVKTGGNFFLWDIRKKQFKQLTNTEENQINVKFSPNGKLIGFVRANNIYTINLESGVEEQLTYDGSEHVLNGHFDWVYEEEFSIIDGWRWSSDGKMIAYWQLDENRVPEFPIINFIPLYQEVTKMRYPKAGDKNSIVKIGVVSVETKKTIWMDIGAPTDSTQDIYVPRIAWVPGTHQLMIHRLNRQQNRLDILLADAKTGESKLLFSETEKTWVDIKTDYVFLKKSKRFLWPSEQDGFLHIYLYDIDGKLIRQLTQGMWDVERIVGVDESKELVYFTAGVTSPLERDLYTVRLDGSEFKRITKESGWHSINMSPDYSVFIDSYSNANTPTKIFLRRSDGTLIRVIEEGKISALEEYKISPQTFFKFSTSDGIVLNGWMIKPQDFDPQKKYPVLMYVYGGPGSQTVRNSWGGANFLWYQLLAQKGYIIVSVDNRGTGARGKEFKSVIYKNLGKWETNDQIEAAKYLASLPYVDATRIGIWGWSYGGYMSLMAILQGADIFKTAVSVAPVTHWKFYDTIYTERYMLTPSENPDGYETSTPLAYVKNLKGNLLIVHGTADDNVHWQNTIVLIDELIKAGKQFETALYPGGMHGIGGGKIRAQLFTKITNFILEKL